jgi:hypothetical protein
MNFLGLLVRVIALLSIIPIVFLSLYISTRLSELNNSYFIIGVSVSIFIALLVLVSSMQKGNAKSLVYIFALIGALTMCFAPGIWSNTIGRLWSGF